MFFSRLTFHKESKTVSVTILVNIKSNRTTEINNFPFWEFVQKLYIKATFCFSSFTAKIVIQTASVKPYLSKKY